MKKYSIFALTLVLTAALFTGCGCTNQDMEYTSTPTSMPTIATTAPTTEATTAPTTNATTESTADRGNGPLEDSTQNTQSENGTSSTNETMEGRSRSMTPNNR